MLNARGHEVPDPTPVEIPTGLKRPLSLQEEIKRFVRIELSQRAADQEMVTFEEADDFDWDDSEVDDISTPYQLTEAQEMGEDTYYGPPETMDGTPENAPTEASLEASQATQEQEAQ